MTNEQIHHYQSFPICDTHFHLTYQDSLEKTIKIYKDIMEHFHYERIVLLAMHHSTKGDDPANNAKVLYCKSVINEETEHKVYAFGSLFHYYDGCDTAEGYLRQIQLMDAMGFDGVKLLDGKPQNRKRLGKRLDDSIFDGFYGYAEEHSIPVKIHLGDPPSFWDKNNPARYTYDDSFPSLEELRGEVEGILTKFPRLQLHLAHFYFLGDDLEASIQFFEKWKNVAFDLTPGGEMFVGFSKRIEAWRQFFREYADRIYFGTDTYNMFYSDKLEDYEEGVGVGFRNNQCRRVLEGTEAFEDPYFGRLKPLNLDKDTLQKIYHDNCVKLLGEPHPVSRTLAAAYASEVLTKFEHKFARTASEKRDAEEMENLRKVYDYFRKL